MAEQTPINFLYLGGDKCGSTWLHHVLSRHPEVKLARAKELFFFDRFYEKGWQWYLSQFPDGSAKRTGEICHDYLYSNAALKRIARDTAPDSVYLITLRNPYERTLSHWRYLRKIGRTRLGFCDAVRELPGLTDHSLYHSRIQTAFDTLGRDRVRILWFDDLRRDPALFGMGLCAALGVTHIEDLPYSDRVLEGGTARAPRLVNLLRNIGWVLRAVGAPAVVGKIKSHPWTHRILFSNRASRSSADEIDDSVRSYLAACFDSDIAKLEHLTGRDLSAWRNWPAQSA